MGRQIYDSPSSNDDNNESQQDQAKTFNTEPEDKLFDTRKYFSKSPIRTVQIEQIETIERVTNQSTGKEESLMNFEQNSKESIKDEEGKENEEIDFNISNSLVKSTDEEKKSNPKQDKKEKSTQQQQQQEQKEKNTYQQSNETEYIFKRSQRHQFSFEKFKDNNDKEFCQKYQFNEIYQEQQESRKSKTTSKTNNLFKNSATEQDSDIDEFGQYKQSESKIRTRNQKFMEMNKVMRGESQDADNQKNPQLISQKKREMNTKQEEIFQKIREVGEEQNKQLNKYKIKYKSELKIKQQISGVQYDHPYKYSNNPNIYEQQLQLNKQSLRKKLRKQMNNANENKQKEIQSKINELNFIYSSDKSSMAKHKLQSSLALQPRVGFHANNFQLRNVDKGDSFGLPFTDIQNIAP